MVRARESSIIALAARGRRHGRPGGDGDGRSGRLDAFELFRPGSRRAAVGPGFAQPDLCLSGAVPRRPAVRPGIGLCQPPARHRSRPDRGQCAARRPHVDARQPDRGGPDRVVERRRRLGRAGGRLHPARQRHRLQDRAGVPPAPQRYAHSGRMRRGRRHRRRLRRAAGRRLLWLRADHRHLLDRQPGAGRHGFAGRLSHRAGLCAGPARHRCRHGFEPGRARRRHRLRPRPANGSVRDHFDARRRSLRTAVHAHPGEAGAAADAGRRAGRPAGDRLAAGDVVRPWRAASDRHFQAAARHHRPDIRAQVAGLDDFARLRLPRRLVLCLAAARRARRSTVRGRAQCHRRSRPIPTPSPSSA